jgi:hypothetical protein
VAVDDSESAGTEVADAETANVDDPPKTDTTGDCEELAETVRLTLCVRDGDEDNAHVWLPVTESDKDDGV